VCRRSLRRVAITKPIRAAITAAEDWLPALDGDGSLRDGAELVEFTNRLDPGMLASFPAGTRLICRRERPHPTGQLTLFDTINRMRHQVFATDTPHGGGSIQFGQAVSDDACDGARHRKKTSWLDGPANASCRVGRGAV
jgi:hypothetical protein